MRREVVRSPKSVKSSLAAQAVLRRVENERDDALASVRSITVERDTLHERLKVDCLSYLLSYVDDFGLLQDFLLTTLCMCHLEGRGILKIIMSLCYSIVYYYNGAQRYEQFLQVSQLHRALILLGLALYLPSACFFGLHSSWCYIYNFFCLHPSLYLLVS